MNDGGTVVIGGIIVDQQQPNHAGAFRGKRADPGKPVQAPTVSSSSQELLFFLTPRILPM